MNVREEKRRRRGLRCVVQGPKSIKFPSRAYESGRNTSRIAHVELRSTDSSRENNRGGGGAPTRLNRFGALWTVWASRAGGRAAEGALINTCTWLEAVLSPECAFGAITGLQRSPILELEDVPHEEPLYIVHKNLCWPSVPRCPYFV